MSEKKCCVPGCLQSGKSHKVLHLFPNPEKDKKRFNSWLMTIGGDILSLSNEYIYQRRRVCHGHFENKYCCRKNRISNIAIPTQNIPDPLKRASLINDSKEGKPMIQQSSNCLPATPTEYDQYQSSSPDLQQLSACSVGSKHDISIRSEVVPDSPPHDVNSTDDLKPFNLLSQDPCPNSNRTPKSVSELGPPINEVISKYWGRILVEGLSNEVKETALNKALIPENFTLLKAPKLNLEIASVVSDDIRYRDNLLEGAQNQLGLGIAALTNLTSSLITEDFSKAEVLKRLSEVSQIFLDLHYENTQHRRDMITSSMDQRFASTATDVRRDSLLFGADLGGRLQHTEISKTSGRQIKRGNVSIQSTYRQQGKWRGKPRYHAAKVTKLDDRS